MVIDPKRYFCTGCKKPFYINRLQELRMLLFGDLEVVCPQCQTRMRFRLIFHTVKVSSEIVKKEEIWRKG